jgi:intracellular sulfur oxidation DsrE/DsrF family protein
MARGVWIVVLVLAAGTLVASTAQTSNTNQDNAGWQHPIIKDSAGAWPLPHAAVQPQKGRIYKILFDLSKPAATPNDVLPGLEHASRMFNVFSTLGVPPKNLKVVAVFHGPVGYAAMNNDVYRAKYNVDNPNLKVIEELKAAGVQFFLCGQTLHALKFDEKDMAPQVKLATSAMVVLVTYQNNGYALMPF